MTRRIRVGIVGYGKVGRVREVAIRANGSYELAGVADPHPAERPSGCPVFGDYRELLAQPLDAVFVCTPNSLTAEVVIDALDRGRHVFSEKPPGRTLEEVQAILDAEARHPGLKLKFGFNHRYHDGIREALALVRGGRFGRLLWLRGVYGKAGGRDFENGWRSRKAVAGGGILLDQGIHMVDLLRVFAGDFEEVKSFVSRSYWNIDVEDNAFALLRTADNQVAMLHSSATHWRHVFLLEVFLSEGYLAVNGILSGSRSYGRETLITARRLAGHEGAPANPREEVTYFDEDVSWQREVDEFAECVLRDQPIREGTSRDAFKAMELVYRIYQGDESWWSAEAAP